MALRAGSGGAGQPLEGSSITCPQGHVVPTAAVATRDGLLVCPVCDRAGAAAGAWAAGGDGRRQDLEDLDVWRRPGSPPPDPPAPPPAAGAVPEPPVDPAAGQPAELASPPAAAAVEPAPAPPPAAVLPEAVTPAAAVDGALIAEAVLVPGPLPPPAAPPRGVADLLRAPLALVALSIVVTLASSCFFVAEAIDLSDAGDVGGGARLTGTILAAGGNLVLALAVAWVVVLLSRRPRD